MLKKFSSLQFYLLSPPEWYIFSTVCSGASKLGAVPQHLKKKSSTRGTHKINPIPCWINEGSPKTAVIYMLSFFSAVTGENNSVPACCPERCCAKANSCSKWQAEKAPRYLMDDCSSLKQRGTFVRN